LKKNESGYLIGIDAGATSTEAVICSFENGIPNYKNYKILKFPPINFNLSGKKKTVKDLTSLIKKIINKKNINNISSITAGIAGARNENDRESIKKQLIKKLNYKNISVYPDTAIAFASIFRHTDTNCGILIAGTGSILYYIDSKGELLRIGGWGRFIDDEGSGYWIGREALNRAVKCFDGRMKKSMITEKLNEKFKLDNLSIIKEVYHNKFEISKAAEIVFDCAEQGDKESIKIIREAAEHLADHFIPLKKKKATIALCGSLFAKEKMLEKYFRKIVKAKYPEIKLIKPERNPVWGAVEIALFSISVNSRN
jgi:N-acetylglucosamine kinase-like BadF-type ATPase